MFPLLLLAAAKPEPTVTLEAHFEPFANLVYQLDMVSGYLPYARSEAISKIWKDRIANQPGDEKFLTQWQATMRRLEAKGQVAFNPKLIYSIATIQNEGERVREIGLNSTSIADFAKQVARQIEPTAAKELSEVLARFNPSFTHWWTQEATPKGSTFRVKAAELFKSEKITKAIGNLVHFYQPQLPSGQVVPVHFMYKPKASEPSHGEQVGSSALMEITEGESPANRIDVTLHELSHFFFRKAGVDVHIKLTTKFQKVPDPSGMAVFSIMNEALATALNNGMVAESLMEGPAFNQYRAAPLSWYYNTSIDGTAKASYDWLKAYVQRGGTMTDPQFASAYVRAIRAGMGPKIDAPAVQMFGVNYIWSEAWPRELVFLPQQLLQSSVSARFSDTKLENALREAVTSSPMLSTLLIIRPDELTRITKVEPLVAKYAAQLQANVNKTGTSLMGARRKSGLALYVIVASDSNGVERELKRLAALENDLAGVLP
jgi:hypothetical protein